MYLQTKADKKLARPSIYSHLREYLPFYRKNIEEFAYFCTQINLFRNVSRKKKPLPLLEKITITDVAAEGKALAKVNDLVVFVPYVVPGDVVDLQVKRKKNKYAEAVAVKFHEYSPKRAVPFCQHFSVFFCDVNLLVNISYKIIYKF